MAITPAMTRSQRQVLWTTCLSHATIHVFELSVPALLILIQRQFAAGDLELGRIVAFYGVLFGLGALPSGYLVDRWGSKALLLVCLWGSSLALLGMALSPTLPAFAAFAAAMGISLSIYHPAGTALITHSIPVSGRVFAYHGMAGNTGVAGASVIAGTLGAVFGWRWSLGLLAVWGLILGWSVIRLPAASLQEIRRREGRGRWSSFLLLAVGAAFLGMVYRGVTTFLPKFLATSYTSSDSAGTAVGGLLTTLALAAGLAGMWVAGRMTDRGRPATWVFLAGAALQAPFLLVVTLVTPPLLVPLFMGFAFFHFFTQPAGNHLVADYTPPRLRGLGYGIYFLLTFGTGSLGAYVGGAVSERFDLATVFPAMTVLIAPALLAITLLVLAGRGRRSADRA